MKTSFQLFSFAFLLLNLLAVNLSFAQTSIEWQHCYGGNDWDGAYSVATTSDGGYVLAGYIESVDGDVTSNYGQFDYWVVKTDALGNLEWQKNLGSSWEDYAYSVQQTSDGGYIVGGEISNNDGDVTGAHDSDDAWVAKLSSTGGIEWQKCLGGIGGDIVRAVAQTADGGYAVAGSTESNNGDVSGNHGSDDFWLVKLDATGSIQWQKCLGGSGSERAYGMTATSDGGCALAGFATSNDGDVSGVHGTNGQADYWVVKVDASGNIQWQKALGGVADDEAMSVDETSDQGLVIGGNSRSIDGDVTGNHGGQDYWIVKLNQSGNIDWEKSLGGNSGETCFSVVQTTDEGYAMAGLTSSNDGDVTGNPDLQVNPWIVKLDPSGNLDFQQVYSISNGVVRSIAETSDDKLIIAGEANGIQGMASSCHPTGAGNDYWLMKLGYGVGVESIEQPDEINISPNPAAKEISFDAHGAGNLKILNWLGQTVFEKTLQQNLEQKQTIDVSALPAGMYLIVLSGERIYAGSFVKD